VHGGTQGIPRPAGQTVSSRARLPWEIEQGEGEVVVGRGKDSEEQRRQSEAQAELDNTRLGNKWVNATGKFTIFGGLEFGFGAYGFGNKRVSVAPDLGA
jgi:hypothetical protein